MSYVTHGMFHTRVYKIWNAMKNRCTNENNAHYARYGGRGIVLDPAWYEFPAFFADMGHPPTPFHTLDRKHNDKGYNKDNCRWATREEQSNNTSVTNLITYQGRTQGLSQWARELGIQRGTLQKRYQRFGANPEQLFRGVGNASNNGTRETPRRIDIVSILSDL